MLTYYDLCFSTGCCDKERERSSKEGAQKGTKNNEDICKSKFVNSSI